jgi:tRNA uridine 5-carboxymethylaminomethyl modification enzyme
MFTSRVEYRLLLREDNADLRLTPIGRDIGLIDRQRYDATMKKASRITERIEKLKGTRIEKALRRPGTSYKDMCADDLSDGDVRVIETHVKYEGFIQRQLKEIGRMQKIERIKIPERIDYARIPGLSSEIKEKLSVLKPLNLGQASRISGVTPAAISILMIWIEKLRRDANPKDKTL